MMYEKLEGIDEIIDEEIEIEDDVGKNKDRAEKRRIDRVKKVRKANIAALKPNDKSQCPEEKRLRKKVAGRKARYSKEEHSFGAYKKCCSID